MAGAITSPHGTCWKNRNVVPIDLAQHPQSRNEWREQNLRHEYATEWLLIWTLELAGKPYNITRMALPHQSSRKTRISAILEPIEIVSR